MANEILSEIRLELDKFRSDLKDAQKAGEEAGKKSGENMGGGIEDALSKSFGGIKGKLLALAGTIAGAFTLKESIAAASEQENAINSLNSSLAIAGHYTAKASQDFQNFASSLQKTTTAADETIIQGGALIATLGKLSGETLQRATQSSLDLAAALNIDQASAFNLVAKAASGHTAALGRYGITVKQTGNESVDFANALTQLEGRFKGLATAQTNTFSGAMTVTKNQFGEVLEAIGNIIIKSPTMITILKSAAGAFEKLAETISNFAKNRDLVGEVGKILVELGHTLVTYVVAPAEFLFNLFKTGVLATATMFTGLIQVISYVGQAVTDYITKPLVDFLGGALAGLVSFIDKDLAVSINKFVQSATQGVSDGYKTIGETAKFATDALATATGDASAKVFSFDAALAADGYVSKVGEFLDAVKPQLKTKFEAMATEVAPVGMWASFTQGFKGASDAAVKDAAKIGETMANLGKQINATISTGVTNSFAAMGAAMQKGENGFAAFGKAMIGVLGDIAIQAGSTFIGLGIAKAIASAGTDPTAYALIAAGGALAVLGGALKAYAGGGGGGPAAASASSPDVGGGVAANGGSGAAPATQATSFNDTQRGEVGTKVEVNVQGNVFDRRETGLMIAETINEAFGSNGVTFATGAT